MFWFSSQNGNRFLRIRFLTRDLRAMFSKKRVKRTTAVEDITPGADTASYKKVYRKYISRWSNETLLCLLKKPNRASLRHWLRNEPLFRLLKRTLGWKMTPSAVSFEFSMFPRVSDRHRYGIESTTWRATILRISRVLSKTSGIWNPFWIKCNLL